jgi:hypothetical protein
MAFVAKHHIAVAGLLRLWRTLRLVLWLLHVAGGEGEERVVESRGEQEQVKLGNDK